MPNIGTTELLVILGVAILLFGYKKLPDVGKGIGQAIRNFKRSMNEPEEIDITPPKKNVPFFHRRKRNIFLESPHRVITYFL